jgi:hypothetical protein
LAKVGLRHYWSWIDRCRSWSWSMPISHFNIHRWVRYYHFVFPTHCIWITFYCFSLIEFNYINTLHICLQDHLLNNFVFFHFIFFSIQFLGKSHMKQNVNIVF